VYFPSPCFVFFSTSGPGSLSSFSTGYNKCLPNIDDVVLGIPIPLLYMPKEASGSTCRLYSLPSITSGSQGVLQDFPTGFIGPKVNVLTENDTSAHLHAGATDDTAVEADATGINPMRTACILDTVTCSQEVGYPSPLYSHQGHSFMKVTQVPKMLLYASAAACGADCVASDGTSAPVFGVATETHVGETTLSSRSASKPDAMNDKEALLPKRRRLWSECVEHTSGEDDFSRSRALPKVQPVSVGQGSSA
jgi:hypothetical protein